MEFKAESEYKYRCVRAKRKAGGSVGLGFSSGWFEWVGGVYDGRVCCIEWGECLRVHMYAAFLIEGARVCWCMRGVCWCRWTSVEHLFQGLKGLLMRRQSSQVSGPPSAPVDVDENGIGAPSLTDAFPSGASSSAEPIYGDTAQDAGDEVRFSVELTRIIRLAQGYI